MSKPACRLYLTSPPVLEISDFARTLEQVLKTVDCASFLLNLHTPDPAATEEAASELMGMAFDNDTAFLIADAPDIALKLGADGTHITQGIEAYREARAILGIDRIIGVECSSTRHDAMELGEMGIDYIAFGAPDAGFDDIAATLEMTHWWAELFKVPCVSFCNDDFDAAQQLIEAGADFLGLGGTIWRDQRNPVKTLQKYQRLITSQKAA